MWKQDERRFENNKDMTSMRESVDVVFQNQTFHIFHYKYADGPKKRAATKLQKENGLGLSRLTRHCGAPVVEKSSDKLF